MEQRGDILDAAVSTFASTAVKGGRPFSDRDLESRAMCRSILGAYSS
jgi:hypothetical protein